MENWNASISESGNCNDGIHLEQVSGTKEEHVCNDSAVDTVCDLGKCFHDNLQMKDGNSCGGSDNPFDDDGSIDSEDEILANDSVINLDGFIESYHKIRQKLNTSLADDEEEITPHIRSLPLPYTGKLVSAIKGSREKEGLPPRKLSVSWAPDVYDPSPGSLSYHPKKKTQQDFKSNKKYGKGKQKGKEMRGGGSGPKDKKHYRKIGGKSDRCLNLHADTDRVNSSKNKNPVKKILDFEEDDYDYDDFGDDFNYGGKSRGKHR